MCPSQPVFAPTLRILNGKTANTKFIIFGLTLNLRGVAKNHRGGGGLL